MDFVHPQYRRHWWLIKRSDELGTIGWNTRKRFRYVDQLKERQVTHGPKNGSDIFPIASWVCSLELRALDFEPGPIS